MNKLCLNVSKSKFMLFHMPQKVIPCLSFSINGLQIENVYNFNFLGLTINCHLDWKPHLNSIGIKIARVIGLLRKLKYTLPTQVLRSIYNSLILPHMHYALLAWGTQCNKIELLQKKALRVIFSKSPIAHTDPLLKIMSQPKLSDLYIINLLNFITSYIETDYQHISNVFYQNMEDIGITYVTILFDCQSSAANSKK